MAHLNPGRGNHLLLLEMARSGNQAAKPPCLGSMTMSGLRVERGGL